MQVLITHGRLAKTRVLQLSPLKLAAAVLLLALALMLTSGAIYHWIFLKAAEQGWPVVSQIVKLVVRDEIAQRDRFMRENLDAMAQKVGEMQAKLVKLEAMGERVVGMAGVKPEELKPLQRTPEGGGRGGAYLPLANPSLDQLKTLMQVLDGAADQTTDVFTLAESRLLETRLQALMVPNSPPVQGGEVGSGFGFRTDPITGPHRAAHRAGLPVGHRHADPRRRRRVGAGQRLAPRIRPPAGDRPRQRPGHALCALLQAAGDAGGAGQARAAGGDGGQFGPLDRPAPALRGAGGRRAAEPAAAS